jgi:hypothetical protein
MMLWGELLCFPLRSLPEFRKNIAFDASLGQLTNLSLFGYKMIAVLHRRLMTLVPNAKTKTTIQLLDSFLLCESERPARRDL